MIRNSVLVKRRRLPFLDLNVTQRHELRANL